MLLWTGREMVGRLQVLVASKFQFWILTESAVSVSRLLSNCSRYDGVITLGFFSSIRSMFDWIVNAIKFTSGSAERC